MIHLVDLVKAEIHNAIARHAPERGGALYGPAHVPLVTHFEYDAEARTTAASYIPSTRLIANVPRIELGTGLALKGIIHSHPPGLTRPSRGDERTMQKFFGANPHCSSLLLPIVQQVGEQDAGECIHWFRVERRRVAPVRRAVPAPKAPAVGVEPIECHELPLGAHMRCLLDALASHGYALACNGRVRNLRLGGAELAGLVATDGDGHELMYFVPGGYPVLAPVVLCLGSDGQTVSLDVTWNGLHDVAASLAAVVTRLLAEWIPSRARPPLEAVPLLDS